MNSSGKLNINKPSNWGKYVWIILRALDLEDCVARIVLKTHICFYIPNSL